MTSADDERLPPSIGGLLDLAFSAYAARVPLYAGLAVVTFALCGVAEVAWPYVSKHADLKDVLVEPLLSLFVESLLVAAVALGVSGRVAGTTAPTATVVDGAFARWFAVIGTLTIVQFVVAFSAAGAGFAGLDPLVAVTAPITWLLWGALGLAGPLAALGPDRPVIAIATSFGRAVVLGLRLTNLPRLALLAAATVLPLLVEQLLFNALTQRHVAHAAFWANVPLDALVAGPLAALQTVFALDFARRLGRLEKPR